MRRVFLSLLILALAGGPVASSSAQQVNAPPGLSGVDEYLETVPGAGGAERPGGGNGPHGGPGRPATPGQSADRLESVLPAKSREALGKAGKDGEAVKRLVAANAPRDGKSADAGGDRLSRAPGSGGAVGAAGSAGAVLSGGTGAGLLFPLALIALTVALAIAGWRRRRSA